MSYCLQPKGDQFFALQLVGGLEVVLSKTGRQRITAQKCSIPCTFDEPTCKLLVGKELPGRIIRKTVEPYEYTTKDGDKLTLDFTWSYAADEEKPE